MSAKPSSRISIKVNGHQIEDKQKMNKAGSVAAVTKRTEEIGTETAVSAPQQETGERNEDALGRLLQMRIKPDSPPSAEQRDEQPLLSVADDGGGDNYRGGRHRFGKHPLVSLLLTSAGAVTIGLVFGFFVLTVFTQEQFSKSYRAVLDDTLQTITAAGDKQPQQRQNQPGEGTATGGSPSVPANDQAVFADTAVKLQLPEQSFIMAQFGAFQADAAAQAAVAQLDEQGYPHLLYKADEKMYLFVATAPTRDEILGLASSLKQKGMDIFVKEVRFPALDKTFTVKQETSDGNSGLSAFMETGMELARALAVSSSRIGNNVEQTASAVETSALKDQHRRFLEASRSLQPHEEWQPLFEGMVTGLNQAVAAEEKMAQALAEKNREKAEPYVWQVQNGVLRYLENYASWIRQVQ